jgi:hypothetical protein
LEKLGTDYQKYLTQQQKQTTATPKTTTKPERDPFDLQHYELLLKEMRQLASKEEMSPAAKSHFENLQKEAALVRTKLFGVTEPTIPTATQMAGIKPTSPVNPFLEQPPDDLYNATPAASEEASPL